MSFNLNEEVIDGHLVTAETKKLWAVEMDLAQKLLDVCKKHNLKIWAAGGTLLGTVRHHGFIPWDDDMDFVMLRDDYNKLVEIGPSEFKYPYFFQSFYTDNFWGGMVKIRRSDTAMIENWYQIHKELNRGVFIDVLVMDVLPESHREFEKLFNTIRFRRKLLNKYYCIDPRSLSFKRRLKHFMLSVFFHVVSPIKYHVRTVKMLSKYKRTDNWHVTAIDYYAMDGYDISKVDKRDISWYSDTIEMPFHDMMMPVPIGYDAIMTKQFGNYMVPVKGEGHHENIIVDVNRSYVDVMEELRIKNKKH